METLAKLKRVGRKDQLFMDINSLKKAKIILLLTYHFL